MSYDKALSRALIKIETDAASSWKTLVSGRFKTNISAYLKVPKKDCYIDKLEIIDREFTINKYGLLAVKRDGIMAIGFGSTRS
jgi:hypothetical protein